MEPTRHRTSRLVLLGALVAACNSLSPGQITESRPTSRPPSRATGRAVMIAGTGERGFSDGLEARFSKPIRLAPLGKGTVLVADIGNHAIRIVHRNGTTKTLAGRPDWKGHLDGPAEKARFAAPHGVAVSSTGVIAVAEAENHTIRLITQVKGGKPDRSATYVVSTLAGVPGKSGMVDGPASTALFKSPHGIVWLRAGVLLVADIGNARLRVIENGQVRTVAGTGKTGAKDGDGATATFTYPMDLARESSGSCLVADAGTHLLRRWTPGKGVQTLDLPRKLATPHGVCVGPKGLIFVAEMAGQVITSVSDRGTLSHIYGTGAVGSSTSHLNRPAAVLFHDGLLWIADLDNHQVKAVAVTLPAPLEPPAPEKEQR